MSTRQTIYFARPYAIDIRTEPLPQLAPDQLLVHTVVSAISAGTEMLFYRGQVPDEMAVDATISGMGGKVSYPLAYGYACAGKVAAIGNAIEPSWLGRRVFAFHPHSSAFVAEAAALLPIPDDLSYEQAIFLPNMETAVNFAMDGRPMAGERVLIFGLGVVGLLTAHLMRAFPATQIAAVDGYTNRLAIARQWGLDPLCQTADLTSLAAYDPDLIYEVSSNPAALASAIRLAGFGTRIVIGSWYGEKQAQLPLGGAFHRNRVRLISSQVSTIDGQFCPRWDKARRLDVAWQWLRSVSVEDLITHRLPLEAAAQAYQLLDEHPDQTLQILFVHRPELNS